ncbi:MAG: 1-acyl-sn-glycerol-3-phosphate acyltransferase [Verrucomicrobia bacterium ADurb.Bin345]|nr:MAG: 1-acyl-sn-glycerol-3-phosphate acyltransferase [Verrucomicrobia bacterium ADurb.Bin345]
MSREGPLRKNWFYYTAQGTVGMFLRLWERFESHGAHHVPATGGCIIAANHVSFLDPPAVACSQNHRVVRFLARDTLLSTRLGRWFMTGVQCVPIDRTRGDVGAMRKALQVLKDGQVLGLFPEGTRSPDGQLKEAKGGIGFLISKAHVPVVPAYVDGSFAAFPKGAQRVRRGKVRVFIGKPIMPDEIDALGEGREGYEKVGQLVMSRIAALKP